MKIIKINKNLWNELIKKGFVREVTGEEKEKILKAMRNPKKIIKLEKGKYYEINKGVFVGVNNEGHLVVIFT